MSDPINERTLEAFRRSLRGRVSTPSDSDYDSARRVWNGMINKHPAVIAKCADEQDVVSALGFGQEHGLQVAIRGGGHSVAGHSTCDDGIVIDLGDLRHVKVSQEQRLLRAGGGTVLGDLDRASQRYGLVTPAGVVSHTGTGGLTLGGGVGWLTRKFGLTCDNLTSARIVLANGTIQNVSNVENRDLLWGLKGGGGNFGIVTEFEFKCHPLPETIPVAVAYWRLDSARAVLEVYNDLALEQPEEAKATAVFMQAPDDLGMKSREPVLMILQPWAGSDIEAARGAFMPLLDAAPAAFENIEFMRYLDLQRIEDESAGPGKNNYTKGGYLRCISPGVSDVLIESADELLNEESIIEVIPHGGAQVRVDEDEAAFPNRQAAFSFNVYSRWPLDEDGGEHVAWARRSFQRLSDFADRGVYINFFSEDDGHDRVVAAFGPEKYGKLSMLKEKYDPGNVFQRNSNIVPSGQDAAGSRSA